MITKKKIKPLNDLTLLNRFLFAEAMEDPVINRLILEIILGREINAMRIRNLAWRIGASACS